MIVVDASALLELLLQTDRAPAIARMLLTPEQRLHAPHLLDVEVAQVLRRMLQQKLIEPRRAQTAFDDFLGLTVERHAHTLLLPRIFQLRDSLTAYDAAYVALAEALAAPLITCDARLARAHGHRAQVTLMTS